MGDYGPLELSHDIAAFFFFSGSLTHGRFIVPCGAVTLRVLSVVENGRLLIAGLQYIIWSLLDVSLHCQSVMQNLHHPPPHRNAFILYWTHGPVHTCAFRSPTVTVAQMS